MTAAAPAPTRKRAPSRRALETRARIFDNAERLFAQHMFEGTSVRDIAAAAGVPVALVNFHGGAKEALFSEIVVRRADELTKLRLESLEELKRVKPEPTHRDILACFIGPYLELAETGGEQWRAYARLIAQVSADERWRPLAARCFDPTAKLFIAELEPLFPSAGGRQVSAAFVFAISAMLSLATSLWRVEALDAGSGAGQPDDGWSGFLLDFCEGGFLSALGGKSG